MGVGRRMRCISEVIRRDTFPKTGVSIKEAGELLSSRKKGYTGALQATGTCFLFFPLLSPLYVRVADNRQRLYVIIRQLSPRGT